jgi:hypothetical protein
MAEKQEDMFSFFQDEPEEKEKDNIEPITEVVSENGEEEKQDDMFSFFQDEPVVEKEVSQTERALTPVSSKEATPLNQLYGKAEDKDYALETYNEGVKTYDEFVKDTRFLGTANEYMLARFGKNGAQQEGESDLDFTDRFIEHYRNVNANTLDLMGQVDWTRSASEKDKANFGAVFRDIERLPSFYSEGGTGWFDGIADYGAALLTDPLTYLGFGTASVAKFGATAAVKKLFLDTAKAGIKSGLTKEAAETAAKAEVKRQSFKLGLKASAAPLAVEVAAGAGEGAYFTSAGSEIDVEANIRDERAGASEILTGAVLTGGVVLGIGGLGALGMGKLGTKGAERSIKLQNDAKQLLIKKNAEKVKAEGGSSKEIADVHDPIKEIEAEAAIREGRDVLEALDPKTDLTQSSLQPEIMKRVAKITTDIFKEISKDKGDAATEFMKQYLDGSKNASTGIAEILINLNAEGIKIVDQQVIDGAIARAGLTQDQFAKITMTSYSDAGKALTTASPLGKFIKSLRSADPEILKEYEKKFGKDNPTTTYMGNAYDFMLRLDRERRALMVTQVSTTVRNVATGIMRLGFEGGANLIESSIYNIGRGLASAAKGEFSASGIQKGMKDVLYDTFDTLIRVGDGFESKEMTEALLKYNPALLRQMDRSLQEIGPEKSLSWVTRKLNGLNMAQDKIFRRAVFTASLDRQLRRIGTSVREVIADGRPLPTKQLQAAVEDSLSFTFARTPKEGGGKPLDTIGSLFVKTNEKLGPLPGLLNIPLGTGAFPYGRFMVNALQFNLQYQPGSAVAAVLNGSKGIFNVLKKDQEIKDMGWRQIAKAREQMARGAIGTAAFFAAYKHRSENQDVKWYEAKTEDGRASDLRPFFPLAPYLLVGELMVKLRDGSLSGMSGKEALEGYTGAMFRGGSSAYLIDNLFQTIGSEDGIDGLTGEKISEYMTGYIGELVGGGLTPLKLFNDIDAAFDVEAAYVRDAKRIDGFGGVERGAQSFTNAATRNLPYLSKLLPIAESATREGPMIKQSTLGSQITGIRKEEKRNAVEQELVKFNMKPWDVMPSTGDKNADAYTKKFMGEYVEKYLTKELDTNYYKGLSGTRQKIAFDNKLKRYRSMAKEVAEAMAVGDERKKGKSYTPFDRVQWTKLSGPERELADEYYIGKYGKGVMDMQEEEPNKNHFMIGKVIGKALVTPYQ